VGGASIAGCGGSGDNNSNGSGGNSGGGSSGGGNELGERVPDITFEIMAGLVVQPQKQVATHLKKVLEKDLGVGVNTDSKEFVTVLKDYDSDVRQWSLNLDFTPTNVEFLTPMVNLHEYTVEKAGKNHYENPSQYANCKYSNYVIDAAHAKDKRSRQQAINKALSVPSKDVECVNLSSWIDRGAFRTDQVSLNPGGFGLSASAVEVFWNAELNGADSVIINAGNAAFMSTLAFQTTYSPIIWGQNVYSGLTYYNSKRQVAPGLATDWKLSSDGTEYTFTLRDGATFHDGSAITPQDVKWNFEWMENQAGKLGITKWNYESIAITGDHEITFTFPDPSLAFLNFTSTFGIVPSEIWKAAGAEKNPRNPSLDPKNIVGSGPYKVRKYSKGSLIDLVPYKDHWNVPNTPLTLQTYGQAEAARRAFISGEINVQRAPSVADEQVIKKKLGDKAKVVDTKGFTNWWLNFQLDFGPTKFREFRLALSHAIDRNLVNERLTHGDGSTTLYSSILAPNHPNFPDNPDKHLTKIAESKKSDTKKAKQILKDAGWGWDDNGHLHYPKGADLKPLWPKGKSPADYPSKWPCVKKLTS